MQPVAPAFLQPQIARENAFESFVFVYHTDSVPANCWGRRKRVSTQSAIHVVFDRQLGLQRSASGRVLWSFSSPCPMLHGQIPYLSSVTSSGNWTLVQFLFFLDWSFALFLGLQENISFRNFPFVVGCVLPTPVALSPEWSWWSWERDPWEMAWDNRGSWGHPQSRSN